jgi:hypothetical protein
MSSRKVEYVVVSDNCGYPDGAITLPGENEPFLGKADFSRFDLRCLAIDAAQHDFDECDGWERSDRSFPLVIELFVGGVSRGRFEVAREAVPQFTAEPVEDETSSEVPK